MKNPFYSVIIPALNEEKFLPQLLDSLARQTDRDFEVIVVDGNSTDRTVAEAEKFKRKVPSLKVIKSPVASLPLQRNLGAKNAKGTWLAFIDADSILLPYFFERVDDYVSRYKPELLTTWCRPDSEVNGDALLTLFGNITLEASIMFKKPMSPGPLTMVTCKAFDEVNGYDEAHAFNEDMDFGLRLKKVGVRLQIIKETLYVWSMRRMRQQGTLKVLQQYAKAAMPVLFFNRTYKHMPGYIMGGQLYSQRRKPKSTALKAYEEKLKTLMRELFS